MLGPEEAPWKVQAFLSERERKESERESKRASEREREGGGGRRGEGGHSTWGCEVRAERHEYCLLLGLGLRVQG